MKNSRFTETQILKFLKEAEAGVPVAELRLNHQILKDIVEKKAVTAAARRELATYAMAQHAASERQACCLAGLSRSTYRYAVRRPDDREIVA